MLCRRRRCKQAVQRRDVQPADAGYHCDITFPHRWPGAWRAELEWHEARYMQSRRRGADREGRAAWSAEVWPTARGRRRGGGEAGVYIVCVYGHGPCSMLRAARASLLALGGCLQSSAITLAHA